MRKRNLGSRPGNSENGSVNANRLHAAVSVLSALWNMLLEFANAQIETSITRTPSELKHGRVKVGSKGFGI